MATMTENGITVEADTPAACVRALKRERARLEEASRLARERAYETLGWIASCPRAMGDKRTDAQFREDVRRDEINPRIAFVTVRTARRGETKDATLEFYGFRPVAIWERANGETTVIDTEDMDGGSSHVFCVGIADGVASIVEMPAYIAHRIATEAV